MELVELESDRDALVAALRDRGIDYLAPSDAPSDRRLGDEGLIASLAVHRDPRLRQALIAFLLIHPEAAPSAQRLRWKLNPQDVQPLMGAYMAAVYLQRQWRFRLARYLGSMAELPDYFSAEMGMPSPEEEWGKAGLHALAEWQTTRSAFRFNHLSEYQKVAEMLFESFKLKSRHKDHAAKRR